MQIRKATVSDRKLIIEYVSKMIGDNESIAVKETDRLFQLSCYSIYIIQEKTIPVGFEVVKNNCFDGADAVSEIVFAYVDNKQRGKGVGSKLVKDVEKILINQGVQKLYAKVNILNLNATSFWIHQGYQFESRLLKLNQGNDYYLLGKELLAFD